MVFVGLFCAAVLGYMAGIRQPRTVSTGSPKTYVLNLGALHLNLTVGAIGVLVAFLLTILFATAVLFALVASHRRKQAEAANRELRIEIKERERAEDNVKKLNADLERRVEERTEQLREANKQLEAFSYSVAHDLRAPLRHMSGFSKLLQDEYGATLDTTASHYLQLIQERAKNMSELVDGLLNMGRIGRQELVSKPTDLNSLVNNVLRDFQADNPERNIEWHMGELSTFNCDPGLMKQVFANLISNAIKYTRRRDPAVIEIGELATPNKTVLFIRDNGAGFNQQYAGKLFGAFQRLHRADEFEGNGVGLATVQSIIRKHGGRIWAEAEVDKGATFFFELPANSQVDAKPKSFLAMGASQ